MVSSYLVHFAICLLHWRFLDVSEAKNTSRCKSLTWLQALKIFQSNNHLLLMDEIVFTTLVFKCLICFILVSSALSHLVKKICIYFKICIVVVFQSLSHFWLFATPWTAACQASLFFTISWGLLKFMFTESEMLYNH